MRLHAENGGAVQRHLTAVGFQEAGDHGKQRRLASPVRTDQRDNLAGLDMQIDLGYRDKATEPLRRFADIKHRCLPARHLPCSGHAP